MRRLAGFVLAMAAASSAWAQPGTGFGGLTLPGQTLEPQGAWDVLSVRVAPQQTTVVPGETFHVALDVTIADGWVFYGPQQTTRSVKPSSLDVSAGPLTVGEVLWPATKIKTVDLGSETISVPVWTHRARIYVSLRVPAEAQPGPVEVVLLLDGQVCRDVCLDLQFPGAEHLLTTTVTVGETAVANPDWSGEIAAGLAEAAPVMRPTGVVIDATMPQTLSTALAIALLAGLLLNIMPCVLPVIPIRILTIVRLAGQSRTKYVTMGLAFAAGVVAFFGGVAVVNAVLKLAIGQAVNLNDAFNHPPIVIAMSAILVAIAANLFGVFHVVVPGKVAGLETGESKRGEHVRAVGMGFMLALLATPCSFAFLATAVAFAQIAPLWQGTLVILAIGVGMAVPHALLAAFPGLVDRLPKPGRWMELFKQSAGFVLLLVAVWLIAALRGEGDSYPFWVAGWGVVLAMGLWIWANWVRYDAPLGRKLVVRGIAVALVGAAGWFMLAPAADSLLDAEPFRPEAVAAARAAGRVVVVKFESNVCIKCVQQEANVYETPETAELFAERDVAFFKANISSSEAAVKWMAQQGFGTSVPLTVVFPPGDGPYQATHDLDKARLREMVDQAGT